MRIRLACSGLLLPAFATLMAPSAPAPWPTQDPVRYDRDIRPILADRCFKCHGPDAATREAKLRLDVRDDAVAARDGGAAIVPGDPDASELIRRIEHTDPDEVMPPKSSDKRPLTADEKALLRRWIAEGGHYEAHWSFTPPVRMPPPAAPAGYPVHNDVDRFLAANLARHGIPASPPAEPATLCRRVFLTLTGLPPTPEELQVFLGDTRADAYERLVDRLLNEEPWRSRFAERFASQWLDAARYADTSGIHMDAGRQIWPWRDWVLRALRDDLPFDRFVIEQIAGDLLPNATQDQIIASGFHRNHVTTDEGGAIDEEYRVEYAVDRTATTGAVFLGLTLGCARCHEHKYDPIAHEDFYRLYAFFNTNDEPGLYSQVPDPNRALEPFITVATPELQQQIRGAQQELAAARERLQATDPDETRKIRTFLDDLATESGLRWTTPPVTRATSDHGSTQRVLDDGSVLASGANPARDVVRLRLRTDAERQRLLCLEALPDPSLPGGKVGRAPNGNAVLQAIEVTAVSAVDPEQRQPVRLAWAWADVEQADGDYQIVNALAGDDNRGWAVAAHQRPPGPRRALFLAEQPFGFAGGTELEVALHYDSVYSEHAFGRVRVSISGMTEAGLARLPEALSGWYLAAPFPGPNPYETAHGPELPGVDLQQAFGKIRWRYQDRFAEGRVNGGLPEGAVVSYVATRVFAPTARTHPVSLGSDDGFQLFVNGQRVAENRVDRGVAADQDRADVPLPAGHSLLVMKVVNTGGAGGFYLRRTARDGELAGELPLALLPTAAQDEATTAAITQAWRLRFSPDYAQRQQAVAALEQRLRELESQQPRTMVMKEAATPRQTHVLLRGEYDKPDKSRPMAPGIPAALGTLPAGAPQNRLGLAQWLVAADNPLPARVQANRIWEFVFGTGIVRTSEDFGMQGEWPAHPELLDWLAVEFRERGFSQKHLLRLLVTSAAFRQSSRAQPAAAAKDPDNRWLGWFPRRRLSAEAIRDQALFVAGLLVEKFGGPSVKPYQPDGLWQEVAMVQSNTRTYQRGDGDDLWRRSVYTYWKRACPPPAMLTFDAPTREFCTIRRSVTNTPLQALVLWNDEQLVEAARMLAQRTLLVAGDDRSRLSTMFARCTARPLTAEETERSLTLLARFRERFAAADADARQLLAVGERAVDPTLPTAELAAWTMLASAFLNLDATICTD